MNRRSASRVPARALRNLLTAAAISAISVAAVGERAQRESGELGDYAVHHTAITTDRLPPAVALAYELGRSSEIALINIAVIRELSGTVGVPVRARVTLTVMNLAGQLKSVSTVREVVEGDAIYYLATTPIAAHETLDVRVEVTPEGELRPIRFRFTQSFD